jgi:hypothetical protein
MKRLRWVVVLLAGVAIAAAVAAGVTAKATPTYGPGVLGATGFVGGGTPGNGGYWLAYGEKAMWTFDVTSLQGASNVFLNFKVQATNTQGGSGFTSALYIAVQGAPFSSGTLYLELANPWKPHIAAPAAGRDSHGVGWDAYGAVSLPPPYYQNARQISVIVTPTTTGRLVNVTQDSLHIGYIGYNA